MLDTSFLQLREEARGDRIPLVENVDGLLELGNSGVQRPRGSGR